jgi:hypothetical protein
LLPPNSLEQGVKKRLKSQKMICKLHRIANAHSDYQFAFLCLKLKQRHHDDTVVVEDSIADIDDCIEINNIDYWKLVFTPTDVREFCPKCEYIKLPSVHGIWP